MPKHGHITIQNDRIGELDKMVISISVNSKILKNRKLLHMF